MNLQKQPFVIDTNIILYAISNGVQEGPDNNSELDRSTRVQRIKPEQVRGSLITLLAEHPTILPQVVVDELQSRKIQGKLNEKNQANLQLILKSVGNRAKNFVPQRIEVVRQNYLVKGLKTKAHAFVEEMRKRGTEIPDNWEEQLKPQRGKNPPPLNLLEESQYCLTWAKIAHEANKVEFNIRKLPPNGETKQRQFLAQAKAIREKLDRPETSQEEIDELGPQLAQLELQAEAEKPYFIPDFEILFLAKRNETAIYSLDNDLELLESELRQGPKIPVLKTTTGPWSSIAELARELKKNLNAQSSPKKNYGNIDSIE